jgi:hypothetical protein
MKWSRISSFSRSPAASRGKFGLVHIIVAVAPVASNAARVFQKFSRACGHRNLARKMNACL